MTIHASAFKMSLWCMFLHITHFLLRSSRFWTIIFHMLVPAWILVTNKSKKMSPPLKIESWFLLIDLVFFFCLIDLSSVVRGTLASCCTISVSSLFWMIWVSMGSHLTIQFEISNWMPPFLVQIHWLLLWNQSPQPNIFVMILMMRRMIWYEPLSISIVVLRQEA